MEQFRDFLDADEDLAEDYRGRTQPWVLPQHRYANVRALLHAFQAAVNQQADAHPAAEPLPDPVDAPEEAADPGAVAVLIGMLNDLMDEGNAVEPPPPDD